MPLPPPPPPGQRASRRGGLVAAVALLATALVVVLVGGAALVVGQQRELRELRTEVADLERELAEERAAPEAPREDRRGLLDEGAGGLLDDLFDALLGGGGLGDLFGTSPDADLLACLQPRASLERVPDGGPAEQVPVIAERVEELRELEFPEPVDARFLPAGVFEADLRDRVEADLDRVAAETDRRRLAALGAIPADTDLAELQLDLVSEQAAGFYDTETGEIVVRVEDPDASLPPVEQVTLAHELEHALADAVHGLPVGEDGPDDADAALAALSLVEGGATLLMHHYAAATLDLGDQLMLGLDPRVADAQAQLEAYPHHLRRGLLFPYEEGLAFTCGLLRSGGWAAVDEAYADRPTTSAEILWPERHHEGETAALPSPPNDPAGDWSGPVSDTFGAAELAWLLEAPGDDVDAALDDPLERAAAWAGGTVHTWTRGADTAVALHLVDRGGAPSLCDTVAGWYAAAFPTAEESGSGSGSRTWTSTAGSAALSCSGEHVRIGLAPDEDTAAALVGR